MSISPTLPSAWGDVSLYGVPYRDATLDITLTGTGNRVRSCTVDGRSSRPAIPAATTGHHTVHIVLET
ncbi:glycosyl hydrolase family 65 protein [Actinoallomurus sp. CA-142502]|uniref:glycosyl hydrolase family 65 protein n=1 Tax=Actinoallomurus sp. CA-142502 TaxID=3239885 RepID=UPI003D8F62F2